MVQKQKYLEIQSSLNVNVTAGLDNLDMTDVNANIGDKLKIQALWPKTIVSIKAGRSYYPVEIKDWNTVKSLSKNGMLTIGQVVNELPENLDDNEREFIMSNFINLKDGQAEVKRQTEDLGKVKAQSKKTSEKAPKLEDLDLE